MLATTSAAAQSARRCPSMCASARKPSNSAQTESRVGMVKRLGDAEQPHQGVRVDAIMTAFQAADVPNRSPV